MERVREGGPEGEVIEEYTYDENDRRLTKYEPQLNQTTYYIAKHWVRVVNNSGTFDYTYYYDGDTLLAREDPDGSTYYYHPDHLGSTTLITNDAGEVVQEITYEPYGNAYSGNQDRFMYTGKELDPGTGLHYYGARFYDHEGTVNFVQPDPIIPDPYNPQSLNRYTYVLNNPYKYTDPDGNEPVLNYLGSYTAFASDIAIFEANNPGTASQTLSALATFSGTAGSQLQREDFLAGSKARYGYTTETGFVDNLHFITSASRAQGDITGGFLTGLLGYATEIGQLAFDPTSAFSYEDLRSNALGIEFALQLNNKEPLSVQYERFLKSKGGSLDPKTAISGKYNIPLDDTGLNPIATCGAFCSGKAVPAEEGSGGGDGGNTYWNLWTRSWDESNA